MAANRRINVASGRSLEKLAHYSRALRVGDTVLQSGTTAIDRAGNVRGVDDVAKQIETIMTIAEWSMGKAGGKLADVVRSRIYVTDVALADSAARAFARYLRDARPASTLVWSAGWRAPSSWSRSSWTLSTAPAPRRAASGPGAPSRRSTRIRGRCAWAIACSSPAPPRSAPVAFVEGTGDIYRQTRNTMDTIFGALEQAGGAREDIVYTKTFLTDLAGTRRTTRAPGSRRWATCGPRRRCSASPRSCCRRCWSRSRRRQSWAPAKSRRDIYTQQQREKPRGYARAVEVGDCGVGQRLHVDERRGRAAGTR